MPLSSVMIEKGAVIAHDNAALARQELRSSFEARLDGMVQRRLAVAPHALIPNRHFAGASTECIDTFEEGHFIACVTLVQAVAEGIAKFVCLRTATRSGKDQNARVQRLFNAKVISAECVRAFHSISGMQRDDFHHMNPEVPTDWRVLETLAKKALNDLSVVEREIFAFQFEAGRLVPKHPQYWDATPKGTVSVFLRGR